MAQLDQQTLREVSGRQLKLDDFDKLNKLEDVKKRNEVLTFIGTRDFEQKMQVALQEQKAKQNKPLILAWLKEVGATKVKSDDPYGNKYETYQGCRYYCYFSDWETPKLSKEPVFYYMERDYVRILRKVKKPQAEKKSEKQKQRERAIKDQWARIEQAAAVAYQLRSQFVRELRTSAKNREAILSGALSGLLFEAVGYNSPNREELCKLLGMGSGYLPDRDVKLLEAIGRIEDKDLPGLVYAGFGDSAKLLCTGSGWRGEWATWERNPKLEALYKWLEMLGYLISTEEQALLDGTHEAYKQGEEKEAGGR